jgi:hypothetical protein
VSADLFFTWTAVLVGCVLSAALGFVLNASKPEH